MKRLTIYTLINLGLLICLAAILPTHDCESVRKGEFIFRPRNSTKEFLVIREDSIQKEVEVDKYDTSYWKLKWEPECKLTLEFSHRINKQTILEKSIYSTHKIVVKIISVEKDYYLFKGGLDSISSRALVDTMWMKN